LSCAGEELNTIEIAAICFSMVDYLRNTCRYRDPKNLFERSTTIRNVLLGDEHPETLKSMLRLSNVFFQVGMRDRCEELEVKFVVSYKKVLGEEHPDTLPAMNNLALTLRNQGRRDEAEKLQKKALEAYKVVLGEDHRNTPIAMHNLAFTYYHQSSMDIDIGMMEEIVSRRLRILGSEHKDTTFSMSFWKSWKAKRRDQDSPYCKPKQTPKIRH
jgi:tetratricopeptide (TPR) repeat protein